jgi:hypothetical protein
VDFREALAGTPERRDPCQCCRVARSRAKFGLTEFSAVWAYTPKYVDPDEPEDAQVTDAEVEVSGPYDDNPTGM